MAFIFLKKTELGLKIGFRNQCILNFVMKEVCSTATGEKMMMFIADG